MAKKSGFKKFIITFLIVILSLVLLLGIAGICVYNFIIIPQYNSLISQGAKQGEKLTNRDILTFAKLATDKQFIENIANIDEGTAKDVLGAMLELEEELEPEESAEPSQAPDAQKKPGAKDSIFSQVEQSQISAPTPTPAPTPAPTPFKPPEIPKGVKVSKQQKTAYDRIMAAASKEEIQAGIAILSKVDMAKVNALNSAGNRKELKKYIKSVLTSSEISTSLKLYRKYKHLL